MSYHCELKQQSAQPALTVRKRIDSKDLQQTLGNAYSAIMQYLGKLGEQPTGAPFAAYYNMDMQNLDVEAGFPVAHKIAGRGEINASEFPGGKLATLLYVGPYEQCASAYDALNKWIKEQGHEATGVAIEVYYSEPGTPPVETKTGIVFPLK